MGGCAAVSFFQYGENTLKIKENMGVENPVDNVYNST